MNITCPYCGSTQLEFQVLIVAWQDVKSFKIRVPQTREDVVGNDIMRCKKCGHEFENEGGDW